VRALSFIPFVGNTGGGSPTAAEVTGVYVGLNFTAIVGTPTLTDWRGVVVEALASDSTAVIITNSTGLLIKDQSKSGFIAPTNVRGAQIARMAAGTNRYGVAIGDMSGGTLAYGVQIDAFDASAAGTQYPFHYGDVGTPLTYMDRLGGWTVSSARNREVMTPTDVDAQNNTLTVAQIVGGIVVHTSVTGGGTVTTDTAANIIAGSSGKGVLAADGESIICWYINDGIQTLTFAGGVGVTIADTGQTIANQESALLLFRRASPTTVVMYHIGA